MAVVSEISTKKATASERPPVETQATPEIGTASHRTGLGRGATGGGEEIHADKTEALGGGCASNKADRPIKNVASLDTLGVTGVVAFFESLGLGTYTDHIRHREKKAPTFCDGEGEGGDDRGGGGGGSGKARMLQGVDGAELARIATAADPDAELQHIGVSARLHRVKILVALGVRTAAAASVAIKKRAVESTQGAESAENRSLLTGKHCEESILTLSLSRKGRVRTEQAERAVPGAPPSEKITPVVGNTALYMVQSIRREQEVMGEILRSVTAPTQVVVEQTTTKTAVERRMAGTGDGRGLMSVPLRLLPELEEAFSAQVRLSSQVKEHTHITHNSYLPP